MRINRNITHRLKIKKIEANEKIINSLVCNHCKTNSRLRVLSSDEKEAVIQCQLCGNVDTYGI